MMIKYLVMDIDGILTDDKIYIKVRENFARFII